MSNFFWVFYSHVDPKSFTESYIVMLATHKILCDGLVERMDFF